MTPNPHSILAELYDIDPTLREHEAELVPLIQKLLADDPAQKPSPAFVKKLRAELQAREHGAVEYPMAYSAPSAFSAFFGRFAYALAGAAAAVIIAVPVTLQWSQQGVLPLASPEDGNESAMEKSGNSYGVTDMAATPAPTGNNPVYGRMQGGGGGGLGMGDAGTMSAVSSLVAPWNPVKYRLEGDLPDLPAGEVTVLERTPRPLNVPFSSIQSAFKDAAIDLSSFDNTTVESFTIAQRKPFGYYINVSMTDGSVSINQMWDQWPHPENDCRDEACYRSLMPKISDIPADAEVIRIAGAFLADHDIDLSGYGDPVVDNFWRDQYAAAEDKQMAWVPDNVRVIYPLIVEGQIVNEAGGEPAGISVQVSVKHKRVSDVWGLTTYQFSRTQHEAVSQRSDVEEFLALAGSQTPDAKTVILSNPTKGLIRLYEYENNKNKELFVPALIFQVTGAPDVLGYSARTVAVPLAKDLLDQAQPPVMIDPVPMPRPMEGGPAVDVPAKEPFDGAQDKPLMEKTGY